MSKTFDELTFSDDWMFKKVLDDEGAGLCAKREGHAEGLKDGEQQKAIETAKTLLADGVYTADKISELLNIPVNAFIETQ